MLTMTTLYRNMALLSPRSYNQAHSIGGGGSHSPLYFFAAKIFLKFTLRKMNFEGVGHVTFLGEACKEF